MFISRVVSHGVVVEGNKNWFSGLVLISSRERGCFISILTTIYTYGHVYMEMACIEFGLLLVYCFCG